MNRVFAFLFLILLSSGSIFNLFATEREGDLAVLEIRKGKGVPEEINTDFLRGVVMEEAARITNYRVMTKENVFAILRDKNIDLSRCSDIECEVDYGRVLQADKLVVGSLDYIQGVYYLKLALYDTPSASIDNSITRRCEGCSFDDLVKLVRSCAMELLTGISGRKELGERPERWEIKEEEEVIVSFDSEPQGAMVEVTGKPLCNTPCSKLLREGAYRVAFKLPKHLTEEKDIIVKKGMAPVKVKLTPDIGYISVQSEPDGIDVVINKQRIGRTPLTRYEVEPGRYEIILKDPKFYETGKVVDVARGEEKVLSFKLVPREGAIKVRAYDEKGNAIEADVYLDGKRIGKAPGTFKVIIGEHKIRVEKENLFYEKGINVEEKKVIEVEAVLEKRGERRKGVGSYFNLLGGGFVPFNMAKSGGWIVETGVSLFSVKGFSLSLGGRLTDWKEEDYNIFMGVFNLEPSYFFLKKKFFLLGGYSAFLIGVGDYYDYIPLDETDIEGELLGTEIGLRMKFYYLTIKTGVDLLSFDGHFLSGISLVIGLDIW
jgi:hypothetical protein